MNANMSAKRAFGKIIVSHNSVSSRDVSMILIPRAAAEYVTPLNPSRSAHPPKNTFLIKQINRASNLSRLAVLHDHNFIVPAQQSGYPFRDKSENTYPRIVFNRWATQINVFFANAELNIF